MAYFSPKIEIINHFDKLINRVDIDIEEALKQYNEQYVLGKVKISDWIDVVGYWKTYNFHIVFDETIYNKLKQHQTISLWSESTKVIDYLKQIRMSSIEEFRKAQEDTLEYYKLNSSRFKSQLNNHKNIEDLKSELYAEKFYFQVYFTQVTIKLCAFNLFTFVTDFYMSRLDIDLLEKLINGDREPFGMRVFDEKLILIGLLYKHFIENVTSNFPNHMIRVSKHEVLNIEKIRFGYDFIGVSLTCPSIIDLSNLYSLYLEGADLTNGLEIVEINIEGLNSLENMYLAIHTAESYSFSIRDLYSLKRLFLKVSGTINEKIKTTFLDKLTNIEKLCLIGNFSYFNLDDLVSLKMLALNGTINEDFNFELFKNLCNQLEELSITFKNDFESIGAKLFDGHCFSNVQVLSFYKCNIKTLKKEFIDQFPALLYLSIHDCNIEMIEDDAFSNIKQLTRLNLNGNPLKTLEKRIFSKLINLEKLHLRNSKLVSIEKDIFSNMKNLEELDFSDNDLLKLDSETINCLKNVVIFL